MQKHTCVECTLTGTYKSKDDYLVSTLEELDEELLSWIKTAYTFADAK